MKTTLCSEFNGPANTKPIENFRKLQKAKGAKFQKIVCDLVGSACDHVRFHWRAWAQTMVMSFLLR